MNWKRLLAYITGSLDQELLWRNEYLVTENLILKNQIKGRLQLSGTSTIEVSSTARNRSRASLTHFGYSLRRIETAMQRMELSYVATLPVNSGRSFPTVSH